MKESNTSKIKPARKTGTKSLTINDIAKLAGVSIATVSKILNQKDHDIGEETKKKINKIISDNNYVPYQKVMKRISAKSSTIGLVMGDHISNDFYTAFTKGVEECAYQEKMSIIIAHIDASEVGDKKYDKILQDRNVEGIILVPASGMETAEIEIFSSENAPVVVVSQRSLDEQIHQLNFNHFLGAYKATTYIIEHQHELIGFITGPLSDPVAERRLDGYKKALYDHNISFEKSLVFEGTQGGNKQFGIEGTKLLLAKGVTAIVAANDEIASGVYGAINEALLKIPAHLSVVALSDSNISELILPSLTAISYPTYQVGYDACTQLIKKIRNEEVDYRTVYEPELIIRQSVAKPSGPDYSYKEKIAIVGSLNMDIIMKVPHIPKVGETILANDIKHAAGGKGANQAVGAGKLNGKVYMIGRVGNDLYGRELYHSLIKYGVDASGVIHDDLLPTGNAYIYVSDNGDNNIVVNPGANSRLSIEQVQEFEWIFDKVSYCLVQMEIPMNTIEYVATLCRKKNVKLILNPAPAREINYSLFENCFLVIPNETELDRMIPGEASIEEKAIKLLEKSFQNVIVTLGEKGCLLVNATTKKYFPAASFKAVDTTGAGDSFISSLTVALSEGKDFEQSIAFASLAAGITVSREGAQPSLPDKETIRMYLQ